MTASPEMIRQQAQAIAAAAARTRALQGQVTSLEPAVAPLRDLVATLHDVQTIGGASLAQKRARLAQLTKVRDALRVGVPS